jgi:NADPH-dependent curcumin reductase CurA
VTSQLIIQGFYWNAPNMGPKYKAQHQEDFQKWIFDGSLKVLTDVTKGIDHAAEGLVNMFEGRNFGKAVLKI